MWQGALKKIPESNKVSQKMQSPRGNRVFQRYFFNSFLVFRKGNLSVFFSNLHFGSPIWFGTWLIWTHLGTGRNCNNCQTPDTRIKMLLTTSFTCWFTNHHLTHTHTQVSRFYHPKQGTSFSWNSGWLPGYVQKNQQHHQQSHSLTNLTPSASSSWKPRCCRENVFIFCWPKARAKVERHDLELH